MTGIATTTGHRASKPPSLQNWRARETKPNLLTHAFLLLPLLIVRKKLRARYAQAQELLDKHRSRLLFPVDVFHWNGALAIVLDESGQRENAAEAANAALK